MSASTFRTAEGAEDGGGREARRGVREIEAYLDDAVGADDEASVVADPLHGLEIGRGYAARNITLGGAALVGETGGGPVQPERIGVPKLMGGVVLNQRPFPWPINRQYN